MRLVYFKILKTYSNSSTSINLQYETNFSNFPYDAFW